MPAKEKHMRLLTEKRRNEVLASLTRDGSVTVSAMAKRFGVTMETIRKDIQYWEEKGVVKKTHGGAVMSSDDFVTHISTRLGENTELKKRVAEKALEYLPEKGVVFLDSGSTVSCFARLLNRRSGLTIVTNSIIVANTLSDSGNAVHLTGGQLRGDTLGTVGMWTATLLRTIRVDVAVLGSSGFKGFSGPAVEEFADAEVKKVAIERSSRVVVVADSSKFAQASLVSFCDWNEVDVFVTNADADKDGVAEIARHTKVALAGDEGQGA